MTEQPHPLTDAYGPCRAECNGCPVCDPGISEPPSGQRARNGARCCGQVIGNICRACLRNPCGCPVDGRAVRDFLEALTDDPIPSETGGE